MLSAFSNILYIKEGIRLSPNQLKSTKADNILDEKTLLIIEKYKDYFNKIEEIVEFIDDIRTPYSIYAVVRDYALANGKIHTRTIEIGDQKKEVEDYYEPNNPDEYVIIMIDHIGLYIGRFS